jgi:CRISPR-associated protein Cas6
LVSLRDAFQGNAMLWHEALDPNQYRVPDDVLDLLFEMRCRELPVDHAYLLGAALRAAAPWLAEIPGAGIHSIYMAGSQNGWERPDPGLGQHLVPSRRTKLTLRLPKAQVEVACAALTGVTLDLDGMALTLGTAHTRPLSRLGTIFARQVVLEPGEAEDENRFLARVASQLRGEGIRIRKALCGKQLELAMPDGPLMTRSLMFAELGVEESVQLQQQGLGPHRWFGCGIFLPHKGIEAVREGADDLPKM